MSLRHHRELSYDQLSYSSSQLLETVRSLREDKETLKSALQTALATRDELRDCLEDSEDRCRALERNNALLRRDSEAALRKAEDAHQDLIRLREQDQRSLYQLAERTKRLEDLGKSHSSSKPRPSDPSINEGIEEYAQFVLGKLRSQPRLAELFRERAHSADRFWARVQARHYDICLYRLLQFFGDVLVSQGPVPASNQKSASSQTLVETGTNTDFVGSKSTNKERYSDLPAIMLNTTTSSSHEETAHHPAVRGKEDYERLMGESEQLLNSLHMQSSRLARLNAHVQETMRATSPRVLGSSLRSSAISPSTAGPSPAATAPIPLSPQPQETIEEWPEQAEIPAIDPIPDISASPKNTPEAPRSLRKLRPRPKKPYQPPPNKADVRTM